MTKLCFIMHAIFVVHDTKGNSIKVKLCVTVLGTKTFDTSTRNSQPTNLRIAIISYPSDSTEFFS